MERLPAGTRRVDDSQSHTHIQIVPRADHQLNAPVSYASPRQCLIEDPTRHPGDQQNRIEKMASGPHKDDGFEDDQADYGSVSLAGIIKLQPIRRKGNKTWRPMQASDLREPDSIDDDGSSASFRFDVTDCIHNVSVTPDSSHPLGSLQTGPSPLSYAPSARDSLSDVYDSTNVVKNLTTFAQVHDEGNHQSEARYTAKGTRAQLFGNLPDPIRLSEQTGKFDGQVVFIGHPNRDISAHQWSSSCFQWVNIGRYSNSRGKVEGSMAPDRLRGIDEPHDTLEYFKLAAENRQTLVVENGRSDDHSTPVGRALRVGMDVVASTRTYRDAPATDFQVITHTESETESFSPSTARTPFMRDVLEDPFVAATNASMSQPFSDNQIQGNCISSTGSLDLTYRFPTKATVNIPPVTVPGTFSVKSTESLAPTFSSAPTLQEVAFGEEAATQCGIFPPKLGSFQQLPSNVSCTRSHDRPRLPSNVEGSRLTLPTHNGLTSSTAVLKPAARHNAPTGSVPPAAHTTSGLSATAVPFAKATTAAGSRASESNASTVNAAAVSLRYSDPDSLRITQPHEVANGLNQQAPTPQNFKGPFFAESKPTTHDPTVALSVHVSEEERLVNWFRDGQRPARQREYTKSLIAAAAASDKAWRFGAIGEASTKQERGPYANTGPFVRLYENLSEYMEEYRNGSGQSYFTRRWKPAMPQLRGLGHNNSTSYFSKGSSQSSWSRAALLRRSEGMWG